MDAPELEASVLLSHALGRERSWLLAHPEAPVPAEAAVLLERRLAREPLAYLLGYREFYGRRFAVRPGVLIPRQETETLVEAVLSDGPKAGRLLDWGTGSGALAITIALERPTLDVVALDISDTALEVARANAGTLGARVGFLHSDGFAQVEGVFDAIVANPPYIAEGTPLMPEVAHHEPPTALYAGSDGLGAYRRLASEAGAHLAPGGSLWTEVGDAQADAAAACFVERGWTVGGRYLDLLGHERVLRLTPP